MRLPASAGLLGLALLLPIVPVCTAALPPVPDFPLPVDSERSTTARQLLKTVHESRVLDDMESQETWRLFGPGTMESTSERQRQGKQSLRLTSPTKGEKPPAVQGRPFGETGLRRVFNREDWSAFNRISVWVYPDLPGFNVVSLLLKLQSEGTEGRSYTDGGLNFVILRNQEWNQVVWEISHLERKEVRGFDLIYRLQGNERGASETVSFDFDLLELQRVDPDPQEGWDLPPGALAFAHSGYAPAHPKVALAADPAPERFEVIDAESGKRVFQGPTALARGHAGTHAVLDFSALKRKGSYRLRLGDRVSEPFPILNHPWREPLIAGLNFFYCERCGDEVPGIHDVCHEDWRAQHGNRTLFINGGWHDAGDLSQGLVNTAEAVWSMLRLAERIQKTDPELAARFRAEAAWGAEWLLKTRFGDGFRVTWATMDFWTDGSLGNVDDVTVKAGDSAFENFIAASAQAAVARALVKVHPNLAKRSLEAAVFDFDYARRKLAEDRLEPVAAAAQAAVELFKATRDPAYRSQAAALAEIIMACQQSEPPPWTQPLVGFFYAGRKRDRPLTYNHRSHEQAPVVALADLAALFPKDPAAPRWTRSVRLYGDYLLESSRLTAPYHMFPAGIYRLADTTDANQKRQIQEGLPLADGIYLRRFPVWGDFRGNLGVLLSQATAAANAGRLLKSPPLRQLARQQLEWTLGRNPFAQSLMYGVGYNYAPQYTAMSGDITGSLPVGIQSRLHRDVPYYPTANCYNYAEVWVHPVSRFFTTVAELD